MLSREVEVASNDRFSVRRASIDKFRRRIKGLALYAELVDGLSGTAQKFILGPYSTAFTAEGSPIPA